MLSAAINVDMKSVCEVAVEEIVEAETISRLNFQRVQYLAIQQ
jgi:hypothetical protein